MKHKNLFENNKQVEYFFINSYYLDSNLLKKYNQPFDTNTLQELNLKKLSKLKENKKVKFWEVIDPKVSCEFLIGIFLSIFNFSRE